MSLQFKSVVLGLECVVRLRFKDRKKVSISDYNCLVHKYVELCDFKEDRSLLGQTVAYNLKLELI